MSTLKERLKIGDIIYRNIQAYDKYVKYWLILDAKFNNETSMTCKLLLIGVNINEARYTKTSDDDARLQNFPNVGSYQIGLDFDFSITDIDHLWKIL